MKNVFQIPAPTLPEDADSGECPKCHGRGFVIEDNAGRRCENEACRIVWANAMLRLPAKLRNCTFANFEDRSAEAQRHKKACADWAAGFRRGTSNYGILMFGKVGTGKTHLAAAVVNEIARNGDGTVAKYFNAVELLDAMRQSFQTGEHADSVDAFCDAPLAVLDDFGAHRNSEWAAELFYLAINRRIEAGLPTIITTNFETSEAMAEELGERTASRMYELCPILLRFSGEDQRKAGNATMKAAKAAKKRAQEEAAK